MNEPTKEAIEEARCWRKEIGRGVLTDPLLTTLEQVDLEVHRRTAIALADVRKKARDDALEEARDIVDCVRFTTTAPEYEGETVEQAAQEMMRQIVELKDQPSGEA